MDTTTDTTETPAPLEETIKPDTIKETTKARYNYTSDELGELGKKLAATRKDKARVESELDSIKQDYKSKLSVIELEAESVCRKLEDGFEMKEVEATVTFNYPSKGRKTYTNDETGEFIREEAMTYSDFQLPMFKTEEIEKPAPKHEHVTVEGDVTTTVTRVANPTATSPIGATSLGDVIDRTVAGTDAPLIVLELDKDDWTGVGLTKAFKKAASKAGWTDSQISFMHARLEEADSVAAMIETLRPHTQP